MRYLSWVLKAELLLVFALLLGTPGARNAGFYVLFLCSLIGIALHCRGSRPLPPGEASGPALGLFLRRYWFVAMGMAGIFIAMLISDLFTWHWSLREYDGPFRLAILPLLVWVLLSLSSQQLRLSEWGYILGAFTGAAVLHIATNGGAIRPDVYSAPIIVYSNLPMLLGFLAVISIGKNSRTEPISIVLKLAAGLAGVYASYLSQARGSWLAIPVLVIVAVIALPKRKRRIGLLAGLAFLVAIAVAASFNSTVRTRVLAAQSDTANYETGTNINTSLGIRFQLWRGSWTMFKEHPITGIGPGRFKAGLLDLEERHLVTPIAARGFYHSHNDVLFNMATLGIFGLAAILALYLVPAMFFIRHLKHADSETRTTAWMGLAIVCGYIVCGLTDCFFWGFSYTFYCLAIAIIVSQLIRARLPGGSRSDPRGA